MHLNALGGIYHNHNHNHNHNMLHPAHSSKSLIDAELHRLRGVMLYDASSKPVAPVAPVAPVVTTVAPPTASEFRPGINQDPLFWSFYVMKHGAFKYEQLTNRFTAEQECKRNEIMALREREKQLKQSTGIKFTLSTIEGDIMSPRISLPAFQLLVLLNSLNAVFVNPHNHVYAEFVSDAVSDKPVFFIQRNDKGAMRTTMREATQAQLASLRTTHYRIDNMKKPIKSVSAYTVAELTEMCHQLKIQLKPKMKKQELYDAVVQKLVL